MKGRGAVYLPKGALLPGSLRLKLRFTLLWRGSFTDEQSSVNPELRFVQPPLQVLRLLALPNGL